MVMIQDNPARMGLACLLAAVCTSCDVVGDVAGEAPAAADAPPVSQAQVVDELPLRRGFYVRTDAECGNASHATLSLVRRDGISACGFVRIERIDGSRYRAEESCGSHQAPPGREHERFVATQEYEILGEDRYRITFESGDSSEFSFCPQERLPAPWRDNDVSDVTG